MLMIMLRDEECDYEIGPVFAPNARVGVVLTLGAVRADRSMAPCRVESGQIAD